MKYLAALLIVFSVSNASAECIVSGCSGQLCLEKSQAEGMVSTCEWRDEYSCYKDYGKCGQQPDGQCGWEQTRELNECLEKGNKRQVKF